MEVAKSMYPDKKCCVYTSDSKVDNILEYDIDFSEGWFLYCHLRNGHLMLKFVPKEF